ncbi:hypothetical protein DM02DRAFT_318251 [Periconia macrospinosa]|uniref:Uncharacterized protein n=1 Tax=Periconia macrospinosa TaxID=97972 RepID=A0A2V1DVJ1_9PLEO|nr:hypothetical protein DM02DRAFT_318251 [Periconia macrospinosa]
MTRWWERWKELGRRQTFYLFHTVPFCLSHAHAHAQSHSPSPMRPPLLGLLHVHYSSATAMTACARALLTTRYVPYSTVINVQLPTTEPPVPVLPVALPLGIGKCRTHVDSGSQKQVDNCPLSTWSASRQRWGMAQWHDGWDKCRRGKGVDRNQ